MARKTPGQAAYEEDCRRKPTYPNGGQRIPWERLPDYAQWSWEREPTPRDWAPTPSPEEGL